MNAKCLIRVAALIQALLSGCALTPISDKVGVPTPAQWQNAPSGETTADPADLAEWWKGFRDPLLDELVLRALTANHDLKIAAARVREARSLVTVAESVLFPTIDANINGGREKRIELVIPIPGPQGVDLAVPRADAVTGELTLAWEVDVFGGNRLEAQAAAAQALGAEEGRRAVQVGLLAQVATHYLELRGAQRQTAILHENIAVQRERLRLLQAFFRAGLATELDIARQQTLLRTTEGTLPVLTHLTALLIHRRGVLLGEPPHTLETQLGKAAPLPPALPNLPGLLPSDLLQQRPDLRRAQAEVTAAAASLGAARADLFPKFFISLSGGIGALSLGGLPSLAEGIYALGAGLTAPIFNAGRIRANITASDARLAQVAASYEQAFLTSLEEVENAYVAYTTAHERREDLRQAVDAARRTYRLADAFYRHGVTDFLSVLDAQRAKLSAEDEQAQAETAVTVAIVTLYRAFGGGWDSHEQQGISSKPQLYDNPPLGKRSRVKLNLSVR
ncbi:MAG: efflux transporter outer membrane subunit [Gammaproteobacteria bacterium]